MTDVNEPNIGDRVRVMHSSAKDVIGKLVDKNEDTLTVRIERSDPMHNLVAGEDHVYSRGRLVEFYRS